MYVGGEWFFFFLMSVFFWYTKEKVENYVELEKWIWWNVCSVSLGDFGVFVVSM